MWYVVYVFAAVHTHVMSCVDVDESFLARVFGGGGGAVAEGHMNWCGFVHTPWGVDNEQADTFS